MAFDSRLHAAYLEEGPDPNEVTAEDLRELDEAEPHPIMDFFLDIGPGAFLIQKCLVVGIWLVILLVHKNFRFARLGLYASLVVYALLMVVHFGIIALGITPVEHKDVTLENSSPSGGVVQILEPSDPRVALAISRRGDRPEVE